MSFSGRCRGAAVAGWAAVAGYSQDPTGLRAKLTGRRSYSVTVHSRVVFCRVLSVSGPRVMMIKGPSDAAVSGESIVISVTD